MTDKKFAKVIGTVAATALTAGVAAPLAATVLGGALVKHAVKAVITDTGNADKSKKKK